MLLCNRFRRIPQVQFLDKVEIWPLLRRQVQFLVFWAVVDMPVYVQRQLPRFLMNFHIFYVKVDSDPEAEFALEIWIISTSLYLAVMRQSTCFWKNFIFST